MGGENFMAQAIAALVQDKMFELVILAEREKATFDE